MLYVTLSKRYTKLVFYRFNRIRSSILHFDMSIAIHYTNSMFQDRYSGFRDTPYCFTMTYYFIYILYIIYDKKLTTFMTYKYFK